MNLTSPVALTFPVIITRNEPQTAQPTPPPVAEAECLHAWPCAVLRSHAEQLLLLIKSHDLGVVRLHVTMRVSDSTQDHGPFNLPINSSAEPDHPHDEDDLYDQPQAERDAREATELARLRRNYSRASQRQRGLARSLSRPNGLLKRGLYALNTFWKNQISVVVPHDACRDHLGTCQLCSFPRLSAKDCP